MPSIEPVAALIFGLALLHSFCTAFFERLSTRIPRHAGLLHLLGEVEVVFGFWALVLVAYMALHSGGASAIAYAESLQYTEPLFVFVIMVVAASRPILVSVEGLIGFLARRLPMREGVARTWLCLTLVPLIGSLITEPAAMTLAALLLAPLVFHKAMPQRLKYAALGVLFVNISIGGTLTSYAAPPVLMVASTWNWDSAYMASTFGWRASVAVVVNATVMAVWLRHHLQPSESQPSDATQTPVPFTVRAIHLLFLTGVVAFAHHPVIFVGLFLFFLGFAQAYAQYQSPLILKEGLLVGFFLAGLVVLGGMQRWWLQPLVSALQPTALFFGAMSLTAITDNAALTYLGSLIDSISTPAKYALMAGAVTGGGLTVIANAPNPAGVSLLKRGFDDESIGAGGLLLGALAPTLVAALAFLL